MCEASSPPLRAFHAADVHRPGQRRAAPDLPRWRTELQTLVDAAEAEAIGRRVRLGCGGIDRSAAFRAEGVGALVSALRGLEVDLRRAAQEPERARQAGDVGAKGRAGQPLAIGAVTHPHRPGLDLGLVSDVPAMTPAGHFHPNLPLRL